MPADARISVLPPVIALLRKRPNPHKATYPHPARLLLVASVEIVREEEVFKFLKNMILNGIIEIFTRYIGCKACA